MANKKILYAGTDGVIKELTSGSGVTASYYDDAGNGTLYAKNIRILDNMYFKNDGLLVVNNGTASVLTNSSGLPIQNYDVVAWNKSINGWQYIRGELIDVTGTIPGQAPQRYTASANADITGTFYEPSVKSLSNVITGTLSIANGGTGLGSGSGINDFAGLVGEYILTASSTGKFGFLTASQAISAVALVSNGTLWDFITQSVNNATEVSIYRTNDTWNKPQNTKAIRVLLQGGGGGGGSGANRNNALAAMGGSGGSAGGFVDTGIILIDDSFTAVSITVGTGGLGANYPQTNSLGNNGSDGNSSSFGSSISGPYFVASGGKGGIGGNINSSTISAGGAAVSGSNNIYDVVTYNNSRIINASLTGSPNTTTAGVSNIFVTGSNIYYDAGGGASGASLTQSNYTTNYAGGNAGSTVINSGSTTAGQLDARSAVSASITGTLGITNPLFLASGGGGGGSAAVTQTTGTVLALAHFNIDNPLKDNSIWNNAIVTGSGIDVVSTGALGITSLGGNFINYDGVLSSSTVGGNINTSSAPYFTPAVAIGASPYSIESWFYLVNTGSNTVGGTTAVNCYLMGAGYMGTPAGVLLGVSGSSVAGAKLRIWQGNGSTSQISATSSLPIQLNQWNHICLQRSGSTVSASVNGQLFLTTSSFASLTNNIFGYGLAGVKAANLRNYDFNGYAKEFRILNTTQSLASLSSYYTGVMVNNDPQFGAYTNPTILQSYPGGSGSDGAWGSGGGGGGASTNYTGTLGRQGGNGGDGYVAVISYKY